MRRPSTARKERARSERQALHSRGSLIPVAGRGEKMVGFTCSGGMSAKNLPDFHSDVRKGSGMVRSPWPADLNKEATARKDLRDTLRTL